MDNKWTTSQVGAREHYAIPRALKQAGVPIRLITEVWQPLNYGIPRFSGRYHTDLTGADTTAFNLSTILFELRHRFAKTPPWERIIARNEWFSAKVANAIYEPTSLFSYSYTARLPFQKAKQLGDSKTVLGQIDPGPAEWEIVKAEAERYPSLPLAITPPPASYWETWREELDLADHIIVNSSWSATHLPPEKVSIIPLAYSPPVASLDFSRTYPETFSEKRPLRVLFLGQANLRKGIARVIKAANHLVGQPIEFHIVGESEVSPPEQKNVIWHGSCPRSEADSHYRRADVFLFPTLSDGFGMTQLEAMAWKLPSITTPYCAPVVEDGLNGKVIDPEPEAIAEILEQCSKDPAILAAWSSKCALSDQFSLESIASKLLSL